MSVRGWVRTVVVLSACVWGSGAGAQEGRASDAQLTRHARGVVVYQGRAMQGFGGSAGGSDAYVDVLNTIREAVGERATMYSIIVPTAQEFYLPEPGERERRNIAGTYARLAPGIRTVDAHAEIAAHTDEHLYFRTDTHWTGLGGYYAYRAFCTAAGVEAMPLERMERRVIRTGWLGSLHRLTRDRTLRPDDVEIFVPPVEVEVRAPGRGGGPERTVPLFRERSAGYTVFLGGDHPIMRLRTSVRNGRRAILVKNSYGNAFAVQLVSNYEELIFVDYRTFQGSLLELLDESERPTDLLFMNGSLTSNSRRHTAWMLEILRGRS